MNNPEFISIPAGPLALDCRFVQPESLTIRFGDDDDMDDSLDIRNGVAVIPIRGVLSASSWRASGNYDTIGHLVSLADAEPAVRAIMLNIDSPGGVAIGVAGLAEIVAMADKPTLAFTGGIMASAAYYIAAASDRIISTRDAIVGSIGTVIHHLEFSGMLKKEGVSYTRISDPAGKGSGNMYEPLSPAARDEMDRMVKQLAGMFISDVSRYRHITAEQIRELDGGAFLGIAALTHDLIDEISTFQNALETGRQL